MRKSNNCIGQIEHGTGCGLCGKCLAELARLKRNINQPRAKVGDLNLNAWEDTVTDVELLEIIRLARVGLWAEKNSVEIDDALRIAASVVPPNRPLENKHSGRASRMLEVLNSRPGK